MQLIALMAAITAGPADAMHYTDRLIFPPHPQHNHGSCVVELPNGDLLACWYRGSGERSADDVAIMGARLRKGASRWSEAFVMVDTTGFPDCNPCMIVDPNKRLLMFWPTIIDNQWESALLRYAVSTDFQRRSGTPRWSVPGVILLKPGPEFAETVERDFARLWQPYRAAGTTAERAELDEYLADRSKHATEKLSVRLGWMPRVHPFILDGKRLILPLYSDRFDFSLMAISDDWGATWTASRPIVGPGNVQPSIVQRRDGTLVAYFRDNGPPPQRVMASTSVDRGMTWTPPTDTELVDTGAGVEALVLRSGRWVLVNNDTEEGRHTLALSVSEDEGRTWPIKRHLQNDVPGAGAGSYSYPSIIQTKDGMIQVTYSYRPNEADASKFGKGESIKHASFSEAWMLSGEQRR